jgi:RNase adapter protein RapZ
MKIVLVTGMSGAGKAVVLKTLEDSGFEAIDNIPLALMPSVAASAGTRPLALASDIRSRDFSIEQFTRAIRELRADKSVDLKLLFIDCDDEVLHRRFTTTRRRHPLAADRPVTDGIRHERELVAGLRDLADLVIDTSELKDAELRDVIARQVVQEEKALAIAVTSFSYKHGVPRDADMVFDVRFLKNPFYEEKLSAKSGLDKAVADYIESDAGFSPFFKNLSDLIVPLLPRYLAEGKHYLTIAVGCTGGQHRSVHVGEKLGAFLRAGGYNVTLRHRDIKI